MIGTSFGSYRIDALLGRGGMGEVYRAFDTSQNRMVALKCLLPSLVNDAAFTARFRRESELVARLREPHVIPIHRFGEIDGQLFIDMRLVDGEDLATVLSRHGPLTPPRAVSVISQMASALGAAHAEGLVHRDVKPSNMLVSRSEGLDGMDFVYLVDFGIARLIGTGGITAVGTAIGSVDYMAPERFGTGPIDGRADVYSLAGVLFECLTGSKPFPAHEQVALMKAHLDNPPPRPSMLSPGVPRGFDEVIARGMAKAPDERFPTVARLATEARAALTGPSAAPPPPLAVVPPKTEREVNAAPTRFWTETVARSTPAPSAPSGPPPQPQQMSESSRSGWEGWARAEEQPSAGSFWARRAPSTSPPSASPPSPPTPVAPPAKTAPAWPPPTKLMSGSETVQAPTAAGGVGRPGAAQRASGPAEAIQGWWQRPVTAVHPAAGATITIGRDAGCDIVVSDLLVSRRHAELRRVDQTWRLVDLNSWNGSFVNGQRVSDAVVAEQDVIGVGHALLRLDGDTLVEYTDSGDVSFQATDVVVTRSGRRLLDGISFALDERCLLAVVGPSGAGKSTLLGALTGLAPADSGQVSYAGRDLYEGYDELRQRIGLVPQDDILHPQLTVRRALRYAARLRFPADTPSAQRNQRVDEVIDELGLTKQATQRISTLSGGQRKRTSVALELLTRPSLLFLDEPTSGLDPGMDKSVMHTLRGLADDGRTVVVVTHSPTQLELCDRLLVLASGGQLAYFGPPSEALRYFGQRDYADMFLLLDREQEINWTERFRNSPEGARYLPATQSGPGRPRRANPPAPPPRQQPALAQLWVLCRRYLAVIAADRAYAVFLALLPLVLSLFARLVPGDAGLSMPAKALERGPGGPQQLLLVLVVACAFMGFSASFRELVKERAIFRREQAIGLSLAAYLGSKLVVLGMIVAVQAVLFGLLGTLGQKPPPDPVLLSDGTAEIIVALVAVTVSIMVLGLLVSALIANVDRGMPLLVLVLMLQLVLCGMLFPLSGRAALEQLSWLVPARWGFAMGAGTAGFPPQLGAAELDPLWKPSRGVWLLDLTMLATLTAVFLLLTWRRLRRLRPGPKQR